MDDSDARRYTYYNDFGERRPAPITVALGLAAGAAVRLDSREALDEDMQSDQLRRRFRCPGDAAQREGVSQMAEDGWSTPPEASSYIFNEALLGRRDRPPDQPWPAGKISTVRRPAEVLFAMDGKPRDATGDRLIVVYDVTPDDTLFDFVRSELPSGHAGGDALDHFRHKFRANVPFLDWHVGNILLDDRGLKDVGLSKGIYE